MRLSPRPMHLPISSLPPDSFLLFPSVLSVVVVPASIGSICLRWSSVFLFFRCALPSPPSCGRSTTPFVWGWAGSGLQSARLVRSFAHSLKYTLRLVTHTHALYQRTGGDERQVKTKMAVERSSSVFSDDAGAAPSAVCVVWWCGDTYW